MSAWRPLFLLKFAQFVVIPAFAEATADKRVIRDYISSGLT